MELDVLNSAAWSQQQQNKTKPDTFTSLTHVHWWYAAHCDFIPQAALYTIQF